MLYHTNGNYKIFVTSNEIDRSRTIFVSLIKDLFDMKTDLLLKYNTSCWPVSLKNAFIVYCSHKSIWKIWISRCQSTRFYEKIEKGQRIFNIYSIACNSYIRLQSYDEVKCVGVNACIIVLFCNTLFSRNEIL